MNNDITKTILFLINGLGVASKDSFDIKFDDTMPNLSMLMGNYLYSNLENINYNYKNGYRNFSLGNDLLPTYHRLESDNNLTNNTTIIKIANDAITNNTKVHLFCFLDNDQVINQIIKIINVLKSRGEFKIFIHPILRQKDVIEYDNILKMLQAIEEKITLYKNVEIGMVTGERTINKEDYYNLFCKESGEKWPDYARKINYSRTMGIIPKNIDPFYLQPGFKLQPNDIALFLNYEDVDCDDFIKKIRNVKLYTLFPMKSFSYAINIYEEIAPLDFFNKKLEEAHLKCVIYTKPDRIQSINYNLNGLKDIKSNNIEYQNLDDNINYEEVLSSTDQLIVFDYDIADFKEIKQIKEFLMIIDEKIDKIYNICDQNGYNMFISSLYGVYKDDYVVGVDKKVKLDYSSEVPVVMIDKRYGKAKYSLKYGNTYNLSNTIINSITNNPNIPTLIRKKGLFSFFKD